MPKPTPVHVNLKASLCTDTPAGADLFPFGSEDAKHLQNTGIERNSGITPIYEKETTFATAGLHSVYTKSGDLLQIDAAHNVRINDTVIGNVGTYAVTNRNALFGYSDAAWTAANTILGIVKVGSAIRVDEINPATMAVLHSRSTTFVMPGVTILNVVLVKYVGMAYGDSLQFILSNNNVSFILNETGATVAMLGGQTWTSRTSASARIWNSVCWSSTLGLFCAVAGDGLVATQVMTSPDGITWTPRTSASARQWRSVCWSPELGLFCAVAMDGVAATQVMTSPDGVTWTSQTSASAQQWRSVCWSPELSLFCAVAANGAVGVQVMTSPDGVVWTSHTSASALEWHSVCWSPGLHLFCAVATTEIAGVQVMTSPDGAAWTPHTSTSALAWFTVCWSSTLGLFCAVAANGAVGAQVMTSPDGAVWTQHSSSGAHSWHSVCWAAELGLFCAVADNGAVMVSPDGITWTSQTAASAQAWESVCWSPALNRLCAVAANGAVGVQVMTCANVVSGTNFGWKFEANRYIVGNQGVGSFAIGDVAATMTAITDATWAVVDQFAGTAYSRAILTFPVKKNAANLLTGIGEVGHNQAGVYSATPTYYGVAMGANTPTFTKNVSGPGYAEATFTRSDTGTNIYYYLAPIMSHTPGLWFDYAQSQTHTLCNGYGRLTDFVGNAKGNTCSLRVVMLNEQPALLSAGVIASGNTLPTDCLGVPLTNVGEFDEYFVPHVVDNGASRLNAIYRYNGVLFFFTIQSGSTNTLQRVSDNIYLANSLSPVNCIDVRQKILTLGVNDYNGRILFRSAAAILGTSAKAVGIMQGQHVNSIDTGDKLITQTFSTATNLIPGIELPTFVDRAVPDFGVNIYLADLYSTTYRSVNVMAAKGDLANLLYMQDTRIPFAIGYPFVEDVMQTEVETIFTGVAAIGSTDVERDYLCYELGNQLAGQFEAFRLFAQTYLFDGASIYLATFSGAAYTGKGAPVAPAAGMVLVAAAPTVVYFLSDFDNSVYTFDGGRALSKFARMNDEAVISQGAFSTRDNTLLLESSTDLLWVRDGVVTRNAKKAAQTGLSLYDTAIGLVIANNTTSWRYTYSALAGSTVVPLVWQSGYFGLTGNVQGALAAFIVTLYSATRAAASFMVTIDTFDVERELHQETPFRVKPADWTPLGFYRLRVVPKQLLSLGVSIGLKTSDRIVINDVVAEFAPDAAALPAAARSK